MRRPRRLTTMRHGAIAIAIAIATALSLAACAADLLPVGTPHDATAVFRPASMVADRETAAPGDIVELSFPDLMVRGVMFVLEEESDASWTYRYLLVSSTEPGGGVPSWHPSDDETIEVPDIGITGPGPDRVVIPEPASPGSWRICTGNAAENVCVRVEIVDG